VSSSSEEGLFESASQHASDPRALFFMRRLFWHPLHGGSDLSRRLLELSSRLHRARAHRCQRRPCRALQSAARARRCVDSGGSPPLNLRRVARVDPSAEALYVFGRPTSVARHASISKPPVDLVGVRANVLVRREVEGKRHRIDVPLPKERADVTLETHRFLCHCDLFSLGGFGRGANLAARVRRSTRCRRPEA
jgi:hypothetical protein